jgi:hypothetical protein
MSCEIFCCEVGGVLDVLVQSKQLDLLFSILNTPTATPTDTTTPTDPTSPSDELDHYLAGYFEKVLEMLFRRMTVPVMAYLNQGGLDLLKLFLHHIYNYSIMQIVQRVLLPHIPFNDIENLNSQERLLHQCDWSYKKETCDLLYEYMLDPRTEDVPSHVSDMLITVLQLSPHESLFLMNIYNSEILNRLLETAFTTTETAILPINASTAMKNNIILASISILESLISRLCETVNPFEFNNEAASGNGTNTPEGNKSVSTLQSPEVIERITRSLIDYIPALSSLLATYLHPLQEPLSSLPSEEATLENPSRIYSQTGFVYTKLSSKGLQLVRFVESLVRLANDEMDEALCLNGTFNICLELMFSYELHSLLHLSVQRIVLILFEGGANERSVSFLHVSFSSNPLSLSLPLSDRTIRHLLVDCQLINRIITIVSEESGTVGSGKTIAGLRRPIVGHIITIGQVFHPSPLPLSASLQCHRAVDLHITPRKLCRAIGWHLFAE